MSQRASGVKYRPLPPCPCNRIHTINFSPWSDNTARNNSHLTSISTTTRTFGPCPKTR